MKNKSGFEGSGHVSHVRTHHLEPKIEENSSVLSTFGDLHALGCMCMRAGHE